MKISGRQRILAAAVCAALLAVSCTSTVAPLSSPAALGSMFDPPPPAPGYQWTRNGVPVAFSELSTAAGSEHCGFASATFVRIGWPLGTISTNRLDSRQYIRDPQGVITGKPFRQRLDLHVTLPDNVQPTGYRFGTAEIHLSPLDQDEYIYVVSALGAERWPRSEPMTLCF
jgi:hypothetical protein